MAPDTRQQDSWHWIKSFSTHANVPKRSWIQARNRLNYSRKVFGCVALTRGTLSQRMLSQVMPRQRFRLKRNRKEKWKQKSFICSFSFRPSQFHRQGDQSELGSQGPESQANATPPSLWVSYRTLPLRSKKASNMPPGGPSCTVISMPFSCYSESSKTFPH